jgi:hypothetical protein
VYVPVFKSGLGKCRLKDKCITAPYRQLKVGRHHGALVRLRADSKTESFRKLYHTRAPVIKGIFAESKCWQGLRRARRWGLAKMRIQSLLIAAVINLKRLNCLFMPIAEKSARYSLVKANLGNNKPIF